MIVQYIDLVLEHSRQSIGVPGCRRGEVGFGHMYLLPWASDRTLLYGRVDTVWKQLFYRMYK